MTELQVKTQKGSLKKFLAMFLAFCVCLTTVFVDGAFAQAAGETSSGSNSVTVTADDSKEMTATMNVTVGDKKDVTVTAENALRPGWSKVDGNENITIEGSQKNQVTVKVKKGTTAGEYQISAQFVENVKKVTPDNATVTPSDAWKGEVYEVTLTVKVVESDGGKEQTPSNAIAIRDGQSTVTLTQTNPTAELSERIITTPDEAAVTWNGGNAAIAVSETGKVTASANASDVEITATLKADTTKSVKFTVSATGFGGSEKPPVVNPKNDSVTSVTVSPKTLSLKVAETGKVAATVALASDKDTTITKKAAKTVKWISSNDKVATVDQNGNVKAVAAGTATITATSTADTKKADTCAVTVTEDKKDDKPVDTTVAVTSLTLNAKTVYLKTGAKLTVKAVVAPSNATDKKVTWTSNKKNIASVDSKGVIKAGKKTGKATITAKAGSKTAKVTVNVVKKAKKTTSVKLSKTKVTLKAKEQIALSATLSKGATSKVKWTTSDKKVAAVKDGVVTAKKKGTAVVTATADGKSADCVITVTDASGKKATALKANTKKISVKVKKTKKIKVSPKKGDKVKSYVSSNKKIATVSKKGVVTGKKKGKATIVVTTKKGAVATIPVTVK